ncbi:MAG TPA: BON domain-containing protein [Stellaceae bacterium]|nr:BON domain-containing protein [Stellaceae bacterium]
MAEYEDRYPDAYGRDEAIGPQRRHFLGLGLPRQVRDDEPAIAEARRDAPPVVNIQEAAAPSQAQRRAAPPRHVERPRQPLVARTPRAICDDVYEQLNASPFIDTSGISISVDGSEVTLSGTINSLIAISLAKALTSGVPGVSRVQVQLRVQPRPRRDATIPADSDFTVGKSDEIEGPVYKIMP